MVIITKSTPGEFAQQYPDVATALNDWYALVKAADWNSLAAVKQTVNSVDYVANDRYVFNRRGGPDQRQPVPHRRRNDGPP